MKYMGHKGKLLPILGEVLEAESKFAKRVADPFCGSAAVSWHLAQRTNKIILSGDLQSFAVARAAAVVERTATLDAKGMLRHWFSSARQIVDEVISQFPNASRSVQPDAIAPEHMKDVVERSRTFCQSVLPPVLGRMKGNFPMTIAYGGHYFSPLQALELDALRNTVPRSPGHTETCVAALIDAASRCAAAPGHTAQPFQPTQTASKFIIEAWNRNVWDDVEQALVSIASQHAKVKGTAIQGDCIDLISSLEPGDLVFADPPYSDVHYSRFYHVLETLSRGVGVTVSGVGRYPPLAQRPGSSFSRRGEARAAAQRSEEHTSELQSQEHISYAVFCLKKEKMANRRGCRGRDM